MQCEPETPSDAQPLRIVQQWLDRAVASGLRRNPLAMALATTSEDSRPSVRMVLLKALVAEPGYAVFYTNYRSRKGRELERTPWAACVLYWEELGRQIRLEGPVARSPAAESDAYFAARPFRSQLNAWVSAQSERLDDPDMLEQRAEALAREHSAAGTAPQGRPALSRPPFWGGYRVWCEAIELWTEGAGRFHTRLRYERELAPASEGEFRGGPWHGHRIQP